MELRIGRPFSGALKTQYCNLLAEEGLELEPNIEFSAALLEQNRMIAAGSLLHNLLCCIVVADDHQGEGLAASIITALRREAFSKGYDHLFLCTKPANQALFTTLLFEPICLSGHALLMESPGGMLTQYLRSLTPQDALQPVGAVVVHCNPPTKGHQYLLETAAAQCGWLHVFVISEETGWFPACDRIKLVKSMTSHLPNVSVHSTGGYLLSAATFPTYFIKDKQSVVSIRCGLDIALFRSVLAPYLNITRRYVGSEPYCPVTAAYNRELQAKLPGCGIEVLELPRLSQNGTPISATQVRRLIKEKDFPAIRSLVPAVTYDYLIQNFSKSGDT